MLILFWIIYFLMGGLCAWIMHNSLMQYWWDEFKEEYTDYNPCWLPLITMLCLVLGIFAISFPIIFGTPGEIPIIFKKWEKR